MPHTPNSLWQALSRICVVGTDQVPISDEIKAELAKLGLDINLPDVQLLQKALLAVGLQLKTTPRFHTHLPEPDIWSNTSAWHELPNPGSWFEALLHPQHRDLLEHTLQMLSERNILFPPKFIPALVDMLGDQNGSRFFRWLDGRVLWYCKSLSLLPEYHDLLGKSFVISEPSPLDIKLNRYFTLHPQGQKQRLTLGWTTYQHFSETSEKEQGRKTELGKHLTEVYSKTKSSHRTVLAPILYLMPESVAGNQLQKLFEQCTILPFSKDSKIDTWLKKLFPTGEITKQLCVALLSEKQAAQKDVLVQLMAQCIACLPPEAWSDYHIDLKDLASAVPIWSRELSVQLADYQEAKLTEQWFTGVLSLQKYGAERFIEPQVYHQLGSLLSTQFVLNAFNSVEHFSKYSAEAMMVLLPRLVELLPEDGQKNMALLWVRSTNHPDFEAIMRLFAQRLSPSLAQLLVDYYDEHAQLYWYHGKPQLVAELRRVSLLRAQTDHWLKGHLPKTL